MPTTDSHQVNLSTAYARALEGLGTVFYIIRSKPGNAEQREREREKKLNQKFSVNRRPSTANQDDRGPEKNVETAAAVATLLAGATEQRARPGVPVPVRNQLCRRFVRIKLRTIQRARAREIGKGRERVREREGEAGRLTERDSCLPALRAM